MEHQEIDTELFAERYVAGELAPEEQARFEEHFFDCAKCMETIEIVRRFRDDLSGAGVSVASSMPLRSRVPTLLLAASLLLAAAGAAYFYREDRDTRRELAALQGTSAKAVQHDREARSSETAGPLREAPLAATVFTLNLTRNAGSSGPDNRVSLGAGPHWLVFLFDEPEGRYSGPYRARLATTDGRPVGPPVDAASSSSGMLAASFLSTDLAPGDYALTVETASSGEPAPPVTYRFRAVADRVR
ncbi:MAG TPA: zf-HC2 domain-containing protein [Thermoanaerobaculia bacterium]|nr:zf-HC2 domain-containing protein [Thermoanaerobaculia bacterium]